jgi:hypothetical protein
MPYGCGSTLKRLLNLELELIHRLDRVVVAFSMLDHLGCLYCQSKTGDNVQLAEEVLFRYVHRPRLIRRGFEI